MLWRRKGTSRRGAKFVEARIAITGHHAFQTDAPLMCHYAGSIIFSGRVASALAALMRRLRPGFRSAGRTAVELATDALAQRTNHRQCLILPETLEPLRR